MRRGVYSLLGGLFLVAGTAGAQTRDLDVTASDGAKLKATYSSPGRPGPGVILLHQCDMNRRAWTSLSAALVERGIHVLAPDARGQGENGALPADYAKHPADVDAALVTLVSQPGVDKDRVAAGGASCGVDRAVQLARRSGQIKALVLLSGPASDAGMEYIQRSRIPVFFAFSTNEGGPLPKMKTDVAASKHASTTIREFEHAGHGVPMFSAQPALLPELADWLSRVLR
jgi:dienelactone hydrolase